MQRITCLLPKNMYPSKKAFEDLGFSFKDLKNEELVLATLPKNWYPISTNAPWIVFVDTSTNCERGSYLYNGSQSRMGLCERYYICSEHTDLDRYPSTVKVLIKDRLYSNVLICVGQCESETVAEFDSLVALATDYLDSSYPDWKDPTKYWD